MKLFSPASSESVWPLVVLNSRFKFDFFFHTKPFGMLIRVPFLWLRWGCA